MKLYDRLRAGNSYVIAEMSANHAGKIDNAFAIIRAAKEAGADCVKIQTYTPDTMTIDCNNEYFRIHGGLWDGQTLYELYKQAYTPWEWQPAIKEECERIGLDFLSTPFDNSAVDFLETLNIEYYKIASFELVDIPLIEYAASKGKPMILSTGMGSYEEVEDAVRAVRAQGNDRIILLKCSISYPAIQDDMNLKTMQHMKDSFKVHVGLSDHSLGSVGAIAAVALGASVIEKHLCISRSIQNPDSAFSLEPAEFKDMVDSIRTVEKALGTVQYGCSDAERKNYGFRRSIFAVEDIAKGEAFTESNIRCIRPGYGMKPKQYRQLIGMHALVDISAGTPMAEHLVDS